MSAELLDDGPPAPPSPAPPAAPVPVAGVVPFSSVDWPGTLSATVFLQGCPWRCPYCHNPDLQDAARCGDVGAAANDLEWRGIVDLLESRRGLLDGVVFTGGEPTMHRGLGAAIDAVHAMGFGVGLHTSGCYPAVVEQLLREHRPEWIGLDIKADPRDAGAYAEVAYGAADYGGARFTPAQLATGDKVLRSLRMIVGAMSEGTPPLDLEVRTTVWPDSPAVAGLPGIAGMLADVVSGTPAPPPGDDRSSGPSRPALTWAIQKARPDGVSPDAAAAAGFRADRPGWAAEFDALVADARDRLRDHPVTILAR